MNKSSILNPSFSNQRQSKIFFVNVQLIYNFFSLFSIPTFLTLDDALQTQNHHQTSPFFIITTTVLVASKHLWIDSFCFVNSKYIFPVDLFLLLHAVIDSIVWNETVTRYRHVRRDVAGHRMLECCCSRPSGRSPCRRPRSRSRAWRIARYTATLDLKLTRCWSLSRLYPALFECIWFSE